MLRYYGIGKRNTKTQQVSFVCVGMCFEEPKLPKSYVLYHLSERQAREMLRRCAPDATKATTTEVA